MALLRIYLLYSRDISRFAGNKIILHPDQASKASITEELILKETPSNPMRRTKGFTPMTIRGFFMGGSVPPRGGGRYCSLLRHTWIHFLR